MAWPHGTLVEQPPIIEISKLIAADVGRSVIYRPGLEVCDSCGQQIKAAYREEVGVLTSWSERYIFVRFKGPGGEACNPEDVSFQHQEPT